MPSWLLRTPAVGAVITLVAAAIVAFGVVPPVRADTFPLAAPARAAAAFQVAALLGVLAAATALLASRFATSRDRLRRVLLGVAGLVTVLLGVLHIDAAGSFSGHGSAMGRVVVALWVCVSLYLGGGLLIGVSAFVPRR